MRGTINFQTTLAIEVCCNCGIQFAMPSEVQARRREDHKTFYCPSGHGQSYNGKTEEEKLRERNARLERAAREQGRGPAIHSRIVDRHQGCRHPDSETHRERCLPLLHNRTFADLGRHMAGQHPDYAEAPK